MTTPKALPDAFHMSLSIGQSLWGDLLGEALPARLGEGRFELARTARGLAAASSAQVRGLLTGVGAQRHRPSLADTPPTAPAAPKPCRPALRQGRAR